jgi:hypothetical protein
MQDSDSHVTTVLHSGTEASNNHRTRKRQSQDLHSTEARSLNNPDPGVLSQKGPLLELKSQ